MTYNWQALHVLALGREHRVNVVFVASELDCQAVVHDRIVYCLEVTDDLTYAIALHELGHMIAPGGYDKALQDPKFVIDSQKTLVDVMYRKLAEEQAAWEWARAHAYDWSTMMQSVREMGMRCRTDGLDEARHLYPHLFKGRPR